MLLNKKKTAGRVVLFTALERYVVVITRRFRVVPATVPSVNGSRVNFGLRSSKFCATKSTLVRSASPVTFRPGSRLDAWVLDNYSSVVTRGVRCSPSRMWRYCWLFRFSCHAAMMRRWTRQRFAGSFFGIFVRFRLSR